MLVSLLRFGFEHVLQDYDLQSIYYPVLAPFTIIFDYLNFSIFFFISILLSFILFILPYFVAPFNSYSEKLSTYECGFEPFDESKKSFEQAANLRPNEHKYSAVLKDFRYIRLILYIYFLALSDEKNK